MPAPIPAVSHPRNETSTSTFTPRILRWGFGAVMGVIVFITALSLWRVEVDKQAMRAMISREQVMTEMLYRMQLAARDRTFALFGAVHTDDAFVRDGEIQRFYAFGTTFRQAQSQLMRLDLNESELVLMQHLRAQTEAITLQQRGVIELAVAGRQAEAERKMIEQVVPAQTRMVATLTTLLEQAIRQTRGRATAHRQIQHRATALLLAGGLAGLLLTWGGFVLTTRKMNGLISRLTEAGEHLQASNLDLQFQKLALDEHNIVSIADTHGNITAVNDKFCAVSQYSRDELLGQNHRLLKSDQHAEAFYADLWATISAGKVWRGEICNRRKDGTLYWVASTILPFVDEAGLPSRYVSVRTDITTIKEAQRVLERSRDELERLVETRTGELAEREEVLHGITNAAQDAVIMIDASGRVTYWNPAAERMFGFTESEVIGVGLGELIVPERYLERARTRFSRFAETGEGAAIGRTTTLQARHRNGTEFPVEVSLSAIKLRGQWSAVGIVRDATERVQAEERLKQLATTDPLTGICNRRHFDEVLASEIHRAARFSSPLSLILFDIDHFKRVNDSFGHQAGDRVLTQLAVTVSHTIRTVDLFARWGGEEFVVLLPGGDLNAGRVLAEKLRMALEKQPFSDVGQVTCSFGVAELAPGDTADALIRKADHCLYRAKASGRNRVETPATPPPLGDA